MTLGTAALIVFAFVVGAIVGGTAMWLVRGRRPPEQASRHYTLRLVAVTAALTLVVAAGSAYVAIRVIFRSKPVERASTERALEDFRRARSEDGAPGASPASGATPAPGVYAYRASGFFHTEVPLLGTEHRDLPDSVPAVLVADGNCWDLTVRYFEQHHWTTRYCRDRADTLRIPYSRTESEHFGQDVTVKTSCEPDLVLRAGMKPGETASVTCNSENNSGLGNPDAMAVEWLFVGVEEMAIADRNVRTQHLRRDVALEGRQTGSATRDVWYAPSGLLVRLRNRTKSTGIAAVEQDYELTLVSTTPTE